MMNKQGYFSTAAQGSAINDDQLIEAIEAIKKASKHRESVGEIRIMMSKYLPDDLVIISENIYRIITND